MTETRKLAAILAADVAGYSKLAGADEEGTLARLRALRSDLIDPTIALHHGRVVKRMGDGILIEFRSVVDAVRCAIEVQNGMVERNAGLPPERRIDFRVGIHLGDVVEESDGDLMGDGVNIAARLEGIAKPGAICLSEQAYWQVMSRLDLAVSDLGPIELKNIAEPVRVYSLAVGKPALAKPTKPAVPNRRPIFLLLGAGVVALIAIAGSAWYFLGANRPATITANAPAAHLSIVVLPFRNLSGDLSQDYFADGITENLTTDLSRQWMRLAAVQQHLLSGAEHRLVGRARDLHRLRILEGQLVGLVRQPMDWLFPRIGMEQRLYQERADPMVRRGIFRKRGAAQDANG
jgi:adenylate cyclase